MDLRKESETTTPLESLVEFILTYMFLGGFFFAVQQFYSGSNISSFIYSDLFLHQATQGGFQLSTSPYNKNA